MEHNEQVQPSAYSITFKINAKGEIYGEFTVRADTADELEKRIVETKSAFNRHK